jgi:hypothetical protein
MADVADVAAAAAAAAASIPAEADDWVAWEPAEWVARRGAAAGVESAHFAVRWGAPSSSAAFSEDEALRVLCWLERAWGLFCEPASAQHFVTPYATRGWCCDGVKRKVNVYVCSTGLAPFPGDAAWAHQGTHVELNAACAHAVANPHGKQHHSYLALAPGAARCEATVVHEFTHALQMHTGGHVDSPLVGWQWEAHAEYCVHLYRPNDAGWAHALPSFLDSAHLPPGATRPCDDGPDGRQYVVWPLYAWVDLRFGAGAAHALWREDFAQRCVSGASRDALTTLSARLGGWRALAHAAASDWAAAVATAHFGADAAADAAVRAACDVLSPTRLAKLRPARNKPGLWRCDAARPLKQHGVCVHRLEAATAARVSVQPLNGAPLRYVLVGFNDATGERVVCTPGADDGIAFTPRAGLAWLLAVTAAPEAPVAVPWGVQPSSLPTHRYTVRLDGCAPHASSRAPPAAPPPPLLRLERRESDAILVLELPSGLANLLPAGPGACSTGSDMRSGEPGATTRVTLRHAVAAPLAGARLVHVSFAYRAVIGYSGNESAPGPRVELLAWTEAAGVDEDADDADGEAAEQQAPRVLYASPPFGPRPWHYDASLGGSPTNYCPPVAVEAPCDVALPPGGAAVLRLGLRFVNGARNMHLQGGAWPHAQPADLQLRLSFAPL